MIKSLQWMQYHTQTFTKESKNTDANHTREKHQSPKKKKKNKHFSQVLYLKCARSVSSVSSPRIQSSLQPCLKWGRVPINSLVLQSHKTQSETNSPNTLSHHISYFRYTSLYLLVVFGIPLNEVAEPDSLAVPEWFQ